MSLDTRSIPGGTPLAVSIPELSRLCGLSQTVLYAKANDGTLEGCRRVGRRFVIHLATFDSWLAEGKGR